MEAGRTKTSTIHGNWNNKHTKCLEFPGMLCVLIVSLYVLVYLFYECVHVFSYFMYLLFVLACMLNRKSFIKVHAGLSKQLLVRVGVDCGVEPYVNVAGNATLS